MVAGLTIPLPFRAIGVTAWCGGSASLVVHFALLFDLFRTPWAWHALFPVSGLFLASAGFVAAWRGHREPLLRRYDDQVQGWHPRAKRVAQLMSLYSVGYFIVFIALRVRSPAGISERLSQAIAGSHSAAFFCVAAMIFTASPPSPSE